MASRFTLYRAGQQGHGFGGFLKSLAKTAVPLLKKTAIDAATGTLKDFASGTSLKDAVTNNARAAGMNALKQGQRQVMGSLGASTGSRKRKRGAPAGGTGGGKRRKRKGQPQSGSGLIW